ncbi:GTP cyclohydrolase II [Candidatus Shapirobacteria bacterium]|nr:GTP cyclohydrolase II [Candidatus Shapirobacteria bacterium]
MNNKVYILLAPAGSRKAEIAYHISKELGLVNLSFGETERISPNFNSDKRKGKGLNNYIGQKRKNFLSKDVFETKIKEALKKEGANIVLTGYPRKKTEYQRMLKIFHKEGAQIEAVIWINIPLNKTLNNLKKRKYCPKCGKSFINGGKYCDKDGVRLVQENFNQKAAIEDFYSYIEEISKIAKELKSKAQLFFPVNGDEEPYITSSQIIMKLRNRSKLLKPLYERVSATKLPTKFGDFDLLAYRSKIDYSYHLALVKGEVVNQKGVLTRIHSSCITGDIFGSLKCDCGDQLHKAQEMIAEEGRGLIIYLFQEGRGINIINKINAYRLQERGLDTVEANERLGFPADLRDYKMVKDIIDDLKIKSIKLLTNNPDKIKKLIDEGVIIEGVLDHETPVNFYSQKYLLTKKIKMGHHLKLKNEE